MPVPVHTVAVVLAGGSGSRMRRSVPKQLIAIAGKTVLEHTLDVFQETASVDEVLLLMERDHVAAAEPLVAPYSKVSRVLAGGTTRNESTQVALTALADLGRGDCRVLFHDAVRPLVDKRIITEVVEALTRFDAVNVAIATTDTIIMVNDDDLITDVPDRSHLRRVQTPQAFRLSTITAAYERAWQDPHFTSTDDCSVVVRYLPDVAVTVVAGSEENLKITHPVDLIVAERLLELRQAAAGGRTRPAAPA